MKFYEDSKTSTYLQQFDSLRELVKFTKEAPVASAFAGKSYLASAKTSDPKWSGTKTLEDAYDLLEHGCPDLAKKITTALKVKVSTTQAKQLRKTVNDVCGFQANVPLFMVGVPTNMIQTKRVQQKQKVVTVIKPISASAAIKPQEIIDNGVACLQVVDAIEKAGYRVNLYLVEASKSGGRTCGMLVKVKSANERMSVSKMAFCMAHPAMLRRISFAWLERFKHVTSDFTWGYGHPVRDWDVEQMLKNAGIKDAYVLKSSLVKGVQQVKTAEEMVEKMGLK